MIAPVQTKPVRVEIGETGDCLTERYDAVGSQRRDQQAFADVVRWLVLGHQPARRARGFERRCAGFLDAGESAVTP